MSDSPDLDLPYPEPDTVLFDKISPSNVHLHLSDAAAAFSVSDLTPMPNPYIKSAPPKSASKSSQEDANAAYNYAELVDVPDGYEATGFSVMITGDIESVVQPTGTYSVGGFAKGWKGDPTPLLNSFKIVESGLLAAPLNHEVAIAFTADNFSQITVAFTLDLRPTDAGLLDWRLRTYDAIRSGYERKRSDYLLALQQVMLGTQASELPEGAGKRLLSMMRNEIQRASVAVIRNKAVDFDLVQDFGGSGRPTPDLLALGDAQSEIRFLEQAFEWDDAGLDPVPILLGSEI